MWRKEEPRAPSLPAQTTPLSAVPASQPVKQPSSMLPSVSTSTEGRLTRSLVIEGEITGQDDLVIDGEVRGKICLGGKLTIGQEGRVTAEIEAREIIVRGSVSGNISGLDRVQIAATGKAKGEITAKSVSIEDGAELHVRVNLERKEERPPAVPVGAADAKPDAKSSLPLAEKVAQVHV